MLIKSDAKKGDTSSTVVFHENREKQKKKYYIRLLGSGTIQLQDAIDQQLPLLQRNLPFFPRAFQRVSVQLLPHIS